MTTIKVKDLNGVIHELPVKLGMSLFDLIEDSGLSIRGDCGGNCCCSTCHVYMKHSNTELQDSLTNKTSDEMFMLEEAKAPIQKSSKLCCMVEMTEDLAGLEVELTEDTRM